MTPKRLILIAIGAAAVIVGALVLVLVLLGLWSVRYDASEGMVVQTYRSEEVVAEVQGERITRSLSDELVERAQNNLWPEGISADEATGFLFAELIVQIVLWKEVEREGLIPTEEETQAYVESNKARCLEDTEFGRVCRAAAEQSGKTMDEFWDPTLTVHRYEFGMTRLIEMTLDQRGVPASADSAEWNAARDDYIRELVAEANIVWHDEELERLWADAVAAQAEN